MLLMLPLLLLLQLLLLVLLVMLLLLLLLLVGVATTAAPAYVAAAAVVVVFVGVKLVATAAAAHVTTVGVAAAAVAVGPAHSQVLSSSSLPSVLSPAEICPHPLLDAVFSGRDSVLQVLLACCCIKAAEACNIKTATSNAARLAGAHLDQEISCSQIMSFKHLKCEHCI